MKKIIWVFGLPGSGKAELLRDVKEDKNNIREILNIDSDNISYIDDIIRKNIGKQAKIHITIPGVVECQDKIIDGVIENSGKDYIHLSNNINNEKYIIPLMYVTFITLSN